MPVLYSESAGVATITLNRPARKNAMTAPMDVALREAFMRARQSESCNVILLTGAGGSFCSGADLGVPKSTATLPWDLVPESWERFRFSYIVDTPQPIIAAMPGYAIGVGLVIACLADIRIASADAELGFPYPKMGLVAEYGIAKLLGDIVGPARAAELLLRGDRISGNEAARIGLVQQVVDADKLEAHALAYATSMAAERSPNSLKVIKQQIRSSREQTLFASVQEAGRCLETARTSPDYLEARAAFAERRPPKFTR
jgi:enoyl-CoA hydratase/carnithine racemase